MICCRLKKVLFSQRVQEIGIRMALGASAFDLQSRIVFLTLGLAALGLALGMAARVLSSALGSLLFGVTSGDPVTFVAMGTLLITVVSVAGYIPARRASRIPPDGCTSLELKAGKRAYNFRIRIFLNHARLL